MLTHKHCWMAIQRPSCFFNLCSSCSSRSNKRRRDCLLPPPRGRLCCRAGLAPTTPTAGQGIPLLTHTPCYSAATAASYRSRTGERSYSSPRGHPLPRLPRLHVVPFLGLAVVHGCGALGMAWSMWSTTDFHRKSTVRGEADSWVHGHSPVFCDLPSKSLCQACWAANLSRRGELHSAGRENGLSVMRNGLYIFKTHQTGN